MFVSSDGAAIFPVHDVHMAKKIKKQMKDAPPLKPTYMRDWREFRDITLEAAAPHFELTHGQLSKIERGKSPYNQRILETAAKLYGCSVLDLLTRKPDEAVDLFSAYASLDENGKRQAARLVEALKDRRR